MNAPHPLAELHIESTGSGRDLVLLHGWALHGAVFAPLVDRLEKKFSVHNVDLPGHGWSAPPDSYALSDWAQTIAAQFPEPVAVLGWSLGGQVAMRWAIDQPQQVSKLVLVNTSPSFVRNPGWQHAMAAEVLAQFADALDADYEGTLKRFLALQMGRGVRDIGAEERATLSFLRECLFARGRVSPETLRSSLQLLLSSDLRPDVSEIVTPTLVIGGDRDTLTPLAASQWLAATIPLARLEIFTDAGHTPFLSHPVAFDAALENFLT